MNSPAHLQVHTLWLSAPEMSAFEALLHTWQAARRQVHAQQCSAPAPGASAQLDALDRHAAALARWLLAHGAAAAPAAQDEEQDHPLWQDDDADRPADDSDDSDDPGTTAGRGAAMAASAG
jgi:hypothetical protein